MIQGVQGATQEGPEPIPELKNIKQMQFSKKNIFFFKFDFGPQN